jgi:hypothetical protein
MRRAAMGKVTSEISMSLDGFITGPNVGVGNGMGDDGTKALGAISEGLLIACSKHLFHAKTNLFP